jgi:hypothetical protein
MSFPLLSLPIFVINPLVKIQAVNGISLIKIIGECLDALPAVGRICLFEDSYNLAETSCRKAVRIIGLGRKPAILLLRKNNFPFFP